LNCLIVLAAKLRKICEVIKKFGVYFCECALNIAKITVKLQQKLLLKYRKSYRQKLLFLHKTMRYVIVFRIFAVFLEKVCLWSI